MAKMTYSEALNFVLTNCEIPEDVFERLTTAKATLDKRAENAKGKERKLSPAQQKEQDALMAFRTTVLNAMAAEPNRLWTCSELATQFGVSIPKISAVMKYWVGLDKVVRDGGKNNRVVTYQVAKGE
jgi:hypothetical protein